MTFTVTRFSYDTDTEQPAVIGEMPPTRTPFDDLDLRFEAFGAEYDDADTMFAIYDRGERVYLERPLEGVIMFFDEMLRAEGYLLTVQHGPALESSRSIDLGELPLKRVAETRIAIANDVLDRKH